MLKSDRKTGYHISYIFTLSVFWASILLSLYENFPDTKTIVWLCLLAIAISFIILKTVRCLAQNNMRVFNAKYDLFFTMKKHKKNLDEIEHEFLVARNKEIIKSVYFIYMNYAKTYSELNYLDIQKNYSEVEAEIEKTLNENKLLTIFQNIPLRKKDERKLLSYINTWNTNTKFKQLRAKYETKDLIRKNNASSFSVILGLCILALISYSVISLIFAQQILWLGLITLIFIVNLASSFAIYFINVNSLENKYTDLENKIQEITNK